MSKLHPKASYGIDNGNYQHGLSNHPLYSVWVGMKQRCFYKKHNRYYNYGGRGINICDDWKLNFKFFYDWAVLNGWKKGLQIDRKDNDGDYCPENCKLSRPIENSNNRNKQWNNTSGFVGVTFTPANTITKQWVAYIYINRRRKHIGCFSTAHKAAIARDNYITKNDLQHKLNFG